MDKVKDFANKSTLSVQLKELASISSQQLQACSCSAGARFLFKWQGGFSSSSLDSGDFKLETWELFALQPYMRSRFGYAVGVSLCQGDSWVGRKRRSNF